MYLEAAHFHKYLHTQGMRFREAHAVDGHMVLHCTKLAIPFSQLSLREFRSFSTSFDDDIFSVLDPRASLRRRDTLGGTAPRRVRAALRSARRRAERE